MGYGGDGGVELLFLGQFVDYIEAVFVLDSCRVGPGIEDGDVEVVFLEGLDYVNDFGVAHVGAVLLEGEAENDDVAAEHLYAFLEHELDDAVGYVRAHAIVHAAASEDDLWIVAVPLCALREVVGIDAYAVAADQSGLERQEIPLSGGGGKNVLCVDAH